MDYLETSFKEDPWVHFRFHKYMAGPKRHGWKNAREIDRQYKVNFFMNWLMGSALAWPAAVLVGRRMKHGRGGVPVVPVQRFVDDWPSVEPSK
jgi:hypothetical protein